MRRYSGSMPLCTCAPAALCAGCYARELLAQRGQAEVVGQCWAERVARRPEHRGRASWPNDARALELAVGKVAQLAADPRLRAELARACLAGAAAWWARRPERYR